ncbi:MAG: ATP-dependent DNA helicase RecG, partial [Pseudomonadota bacterium]
AVEQGQDGGICTLIVTVEKHVPAPRRNLPYRVDVRDETGSIQLIFFHARGDYLLKQLPPGEARLISGKFEWRHGKAQMVHPDIIERPELKDQVARVEPVYGLTAGLTLKVMQKAMGDTLPRVPAMPDWLPAGLEKREKWSDFTISINGLHGSSDTPPMLTTDAPARRRLAYDELLADQLALALVRNRQRKSHGRVLPPAGPWRARALAALPFALTGAQERALRDIDHDLGAPTRMLRLLQGDVGSGKTIVAFLTALRAMEAGYQAALMAPTELLARQHLETIQPWADACDVRVALITGKVDRRTRQANQVQLEDGTIKLAIGTHALFQTKVDFDNLGLVIVDEQHRFGVGQRLALGDKGDRVDMLVMTATPIPRTLSMTAYGDMDVSILDEKPPGRQPVTTRAVTNDRLADVIERLKVATSKGERAYWVCPLVEDSEKVDLVAAEQRAATLEKQLPGQVGLVHGRMETAEKDAVVSAFARGDLSVLVATTVIEVGINVPEATIMVIEDANRFGLAQLHQLRGRVGRGDKPSSCVLLYQNKAGATARDRLKILRETDDGFRIAEEDLRLRGAGEMLGTRQAGLPGFKIADLDHHQDLLQMAHQDARMIVDQDPELKAARSDALRVLLYLFERDAAIRYLKSG